MIKALFYKEWIKTRAIVLLIAAVYFGFLIYAFINTQQAFRVQGAVGTWVGILSKKTSILPETMFFLPVLTGLLLASAQFVPETIAKRFKLTLHLPLKEWKIVSISLFYGLLILFVIYSFSSLVLLIMMQSFYPAEIFAQVYEASLLWFYSAILSYLFVAWICIEPSWKQRVCNTLIAVALLSIFFINSKPGAYAVLMPYLPFLSLVCFGFPFYSAIRFKEGVQ